MTCPGRSPDGSLLIAAGLTRSFRRRGQRPEVRAVDHVSFTVDTGEAVGLVGASGAGKSTVAHILAGLVDPDAGTVTFAGHDLTALSRRERRRVQGQVHLIFQDPYSALAPHLRVHELVSEPLRIQQQLTRGQRRARAAAALEEVQLTPVGRYAERFPHELSGGELQRVALARAITARPQLIIADEPSQMLDAALRVELATLLDGLRQRHGMAQLHITHDLALTHHLCDRLLVMHQGRIVQQGRTVDVIAAPSHPQTVALVDAVRRLQTPVASTAR